MTARTKALSAIALAGALTLTACGGSDANNNNGGDNNNGGGTTSTGGATGGGAAAKAECFDGDLKAEGSSAQKNAIEIAIKDFGDQCSGANVEYTGSGSGTGIKQFIAKQADFAGSDAPLKTKAGDDGKIEKEEAKNSCGSEAWNLPMVAGPIAIAYKLNGVDKLILDGETVSKIFAGKITKWDDEAIKKLNPEAKLPSSEIKVYFRSDSSGTTENFTHYMEAAGNGAWTDKPGKKWTGKVGEGKEKSSGVAQAVAGQEGSITYVEASYVKQNNLSMAQIDKGDGKPVEATGANTAKALATAKQKGEGNDLALELDYGTKTEGAYPIALVTYEIVCSKYPDAEKGKAVKSFMKFMADPATQASFEAKDFAPLPDELRTKITAAADAMS